MLNIFLSLLFEICYIKENECVDIKTHFHILLYNPLFPFYFMAVQAHIEVHILNKQFNIQMILFTLFLEYHCLH